MNKNKTCLNISKTEVVSFKSSRKLTDVPLKLKFNGKRLYPIKLNKANAILSKIRHFIDRKTPKSIYHAIFEPHLCYSSLTWAQN